MARCVPGTSDRLASGSIRLLARQSDDIVIDQRPRSIRAGVLVLRWEQTKTVNVANARPRARPIA